MCETGILLLALSHYKMKYSQVPLGISECVDEELQEPLYVNL